MVAPGFTVSNNPRLGPVFGFCLALLCGLAAVCADSEAAMIDKARGALADGRPDEARRMARTILADYPGDPEALLVMARTEPGGLSAQSWALQALNSAGNRPPGDEACLLLIEILAATKSYGAILEKGEEFLRTFAGKSHSVDAVRWWTILAQLKTGQVRVAETELKNAIAENPSSEWVKRLYLLSADSRTDLEAGVRAYRDLSREDDHYLESQSLIGLAQAYERLGEHDRMMLYRGILTEKYPNASMLYSGTSGSSVEADSRPGDDHAEKLADIVYTVQLGAFADKDNAQRLHEKYGAQGYTVHFYNRKIAGKTYWVVQVGSFTRLEKARELLEKLQDEDDTAYRIVVR
jgi:tetratricopeptide (TPR) repeat protein